MRWFTRKKEPSKADSNEEPVNAWGVYKDNPLPELSESYDSDFSNNLPALPSFPNNSTGESLGIQAIKHAINPRFDEPGIYDNETHKEFSNDSVINEHLVTLSKSRFPEIVEEFSREAEPIFVKLDKFKYAVENFEKVREKVGDIGKMLEQIKEIREKEDAELRSWEENLRSIKLKIESIDNSLFKKG